MSKKAVCYYRYSSERQTEQSIEGQRRVCREYAEKNGYEIIAEYADRAITGKTDKRPEFLKMMRASSEKTFEFVIVYKLDRFSRNRYDSVVYKYQLEKNGVKVLSATETISESFDGKLMTALLEAMAEMYSDDLSQKVARGMNESIIKGNYIGGHILLGYKVENKKVLIDEENAEIVRYVFNEYARGVPQRKIIAELNARGYKTTLNKKFANNSIIHLLKNRKYTGEYVSQRGQVNNNYYPAIIDKDTFEKVQQRLIENKHRAGSQKAKNEYILTGKAFCGHCGAPLIGGGGTSHTKKQHNYYVCSERWYKKTCKKKYEPKDELEKTVIRATLQHVLNPKIINGLADMLTQAQNDDGILKDIQRAERRIKVISGEIEKKYNLFCDAESATLRKMLNDDIENLSIEREAVEKEIAKLRLIQNTKKTKPEIQEFFNRFIERKTEDLEYCKRIINEFIDKIYIFDDKLIIYYNIFDKSGISYNKMLTDIETTDNQGSSNIKNISQPRETELNRLWFNSVFSNDFAILQ